MYKLIGALFIALFVGTTGIAGEVNATLLDKFAQLEQMERELVSETCGATSDTVGHYRWTCYAVDECGKRFEGCGKCYDHAVGLAISRCESGTRDRGTCRLSYCTEH